MSVRAMLARVQRLELTGGTALARLIGPLDEFDAFIRDGIAVGKLDPTDAPVALASVRRWVREEV